MSSTSASSLLFLLLLLVLLPFVAGGRHHDLAGVQPLSRVAIHRARLSLEDQAFVRASPPLLGLKGEDTEWVTVELGSPNPTPDDWIGVFSPANFNASTCSVENPEDQVPLICTSPIKMTVTWTSGYDINEAITFVEWGPKWGPITRSPAGTLTFNRGTLCGSPARTFGWRDPGYIHTSFLKELWPNAEYTYKLGHQLFNGSYIWSKSFSFRASPFPGQNSVQQIIIFGDMGKAERDGSNEYSNYQPGSLNTTDMIVKDLDNVDIVFHIGDITYANGYISQWDQFTAQVEPISSRVPYMLASGNHERDWPNTGSFYNTIDSGGECGVLAETMFYVPAENRANYWYSTDFGMFHFCIADTEHDWREGSEQYAFIEDCLASVDRKKQPWLIFAAHRVLGFSSGMNYVMEGSFEEPMGRESLQKLWQKYRVDIAFYGHVHNYERTCPIYQNQCVNNEASHYSGTMNGTIHVVAGGGGSHLSNFSDVVPRWSLFRDVNFGFVKLTAFNRSSLLFEYKRSSDGRVYDSFTIYRDYRDVLACVHDSCPPTTLAT